MWPRVVETMFGFWMMASPFIFHHPDRSGVLWCNDLFSGLAICTLGLLSFWRPLRHIHVGNAAIGAWLIGFGFLSASVPASPASQNHMLVGLLLLMFGIIPNQASLPPDPWLQLMRSADTEAESDESSG